MFNILSMLGKNKPEPDALHSLKTITRWVKTLPAGNVFSAHEQVLQKLVEFNRKNAPHDKDSLDVLLHLDEYTQPLQAALCQQYLRNPRMSRVMESRLWHAIYQFYWEVARAYHAFILSYVAAPANNPLKAAMPQITLRTLHNFGNVFKWHYFRYEKPHAKLWLRLHNLYRIAEFEGFSKTDLPLYPQDSSITRCMDQYTRALLLAQLDTSALYPKQIEMADQWLNQWSHLIAQDRQFDPATHTFYVALSDGVGARRIRNPDFSESCRFMATSSLRDKINQTRRALQAGGLPAQLGLCEECRLPESLELLDYAERQWSPIDNREQRKSPRTSTKKVVDVAQGFNAICALVKQGGNSANVLSEVDTELKYEEMIDMKLYGFVTESTRTRNRPALPAPSEKTPPHERWVMEDESEHGLGASVPAEANDWVRLDSMIGIQAERNAPWKIGVVRRLSRPGDGLCQVGIEILSHKPRMLLIRPQSAPGLHGYSVAGVEAADSTLPVPVIFTSPINNNQCELLLEAAQYASGRSFQTSSSTHCDVVRLRDVIEKGDGWLRVAVDIAPATTDP